MRRRRGVAGGKTERAGGGGSDKAPDTEGETDCLNGKLRKKKKKMSKRIYSADGGVSLKREVKNQYVCSEIDIAIQN